VINIVRENFYKHGYLLIVAAWLYTFSFLFSNYWSYNYSIARVKTQLEEFIKKGETQFEDFTKDSAFIDALVLKGYIPKSSLDFKSNDIGLYVYTRDEAGELRIEYWNNNKVAPAVKDLIKADGKFYSEYRNGNFEFIKKTFYLGRRQVTAAALIPIQWTYSFGNNYFPASATIEERFKIAESQADFYIENGDGRVLLGLKEKGGTNSETSGPWSITFRIVSLIFILIFINVLSFEVATVFGWKKGFVFLVCVILFLRYLSYKLPFPFSYRNFDLFYSGIYGTNSLFPSLGDLLINFIILFWFISFLKFTAITNFKNTPSIKGQAAKWTLTICSVALIALTFSFSSVIRSLIVDSKISFDVTNFYRLDIYSALSFIILSLIVLCFYHLSHIALIFIDKCVQLPYWSRYLSVTLIGLFYLSFHLNSPSNSTNLFALIWLLFYMFILERRKDDMYVPILRSSFFLIWLIFFAASISALIISQNHYKELEENKLIAEKLAAEADPSAQLSMGIAIINIDSEFLATNYDRFTSENLNKKIKDSLISENFSSFLTSYDTKLYTFDSNLHPLYNDDSASYLSIKNLINKSKKSIYPEIYYFEKPAYRFSLFYQKQIKDPLGNAKGYFFVIAEPKRYESQALYPVLLNQDNKTEEKFNNTYAIYNRGQLILNEGSYNFLSYIPKNRLLKQEYKVERKGDAIEFWYNAGYNKLVIIVKRYSFFIEAITLFAYLFASFLFIVISYQLMVYLIRFKFRFGDLKKGVRLTVRQQIQGSIIFISIFSFLVIGVATISFYIKRFKQTNEERLVRTIKTLGDEIEIQIASHTFSDDVLNVYERGANSQVDEIFKEVSLVHNVEASFFDPNGFLKVSSLAYLYNNNILSRMMDPEAYYNLKYKKEIQVIQEETTGKFSYLSVYIPVKDENGDLYGYLNIPYWRSRGDLNQEISNFLVTLINLNAFIFVIAGAISVLLTNRITSSFSLIGGKMKDINLGRANEEITWNTNDEIGALVSEYNKMVKKLEESAVALAKSEREGAWREMARQVAHEIKNPLTPMKLSIQYLQRAIKEKSPNTQELSEKVSTTLVEQIDQLAKIASDFSQFANIGNVAVEQFDINELLESLINLYQGNEKLHINFNRPLRQAIINADKGQINRLFTNLFQNAIEAADSQPYVSIVINEEINANKLRIDVTDNGSGIAAEKRPKIFTPNFTTKSSGTGLGLAISKGIVEKANGRIWFDTVEGEGTTFHVLLPLVNLPE